jgi:hypothetical protein
MMELIPVWFYLITSVIYLTSSVIGFLTSYFALKASKISKNKSFLILSLSFLIISLGLLILFGISVYIYTTLELYKGSGISLNLLNHYGFSTYYILSLVGYLLLVFMYLPKINKLFVLYVPIWYASFDKFHIISFVLIMYVIIRSLINSFRKKNLDSYLVTFAFISLAMFHLLLLLMSFSQSMYIIANLLLIAGFLSLLYMLVRVNRK